MPERKVVIATFENEFDAEIVIGHLEAAGISAGLIKDDAGGMLPSLQQSRGVRVLVPESQQQQAQDLLNDLQDETSDSSQE